MVNQPEVKIERTEEGYVAKVQGKGQTGPLPSLPEARRAGEELRQIGVKPKFPVFQFFIGIPVYGAFLAVVGMALGWSWIDTGTTFVMVLPVYIALFALLRP